MSCPSHEPLFLAILEDEISDSWLHPVFPSFPPTPPFIPLSLLYPSLPQRQAGGDGNQASGSVFLSCRSPQVPTCHYPRQCLGSAVAQLTSSPTATAQGAPVPPPAQRQARSPPHRPIPPPIQLPDRTHHAHIRKGQHPGSNSKQYGSWRQFSARWHLRCFGWRSHWKLTEGKKGEDIGEKSKAWRREKLSDSVTQVSPSVSISGRGRVNVKKNQCISTL